MITALAGFEVIVKSPMRIFRARHADHREAVQLNAVERALFDVPAHHREFAGLSDLAVGVAGAGINVGGASLQIFAVHAVVGW